MESTIIKCSCFQLCIFIQYGMSCILKSMRIMKVQHKICVECIVLKHIVPGLKCLFILVQLMRQYVRTAFESPPMKKIIIYQHH